MKQGLNTKPRRHEISLLNVILCLAVIFIHIISYAVSAFPVGSAKYNFAMFPWRMASIAVQGFVMLAGVKFFLTGKDNVPYGKYLKSRFKAIVVPYIFVFAVYYAFYVVIYDYPLNADFILKQFFTGSLVCHLYFIPLILQFDLLSPLWKRIVGRVSGIIVVPFCLLLGQIFEIYFPNMLSIAFDDVNFIYNDRLFTTYLFYWIAGCYIGKNYDNFLKILKENFAACAGAFTISVVLFGYYTYLAFNNIAYIPFMNQVHCLYVICALVFLYALAVKYGTDLMQKVKLLSFVDRASYNIYLWHMLVLFGANYVLEYFGILSQTVAFVLRVIIVYPLTSGLCILYSNFKKRIKIRKEL